MGEGDVVGRAWYELGAHDDRLDRDLDDADRKVKAASNQGAAHYEKTYAGASQRVSAGFGGVRNALAAIGVGIGLTTVMSFFGGAIGAASDLNEEVSKAGVVFGSSAAKVEAFADRADVALGQSKQQALAAAGGFGNMFRTIGFAEDAAGDMSITMLQLASDMASFNNQDPSDMLIRLRAGLSGEAEPLRQFGVLLSEARVKEEAYATGIALVGKELTETQKVQARYSLILKDTALQQGDFARTATGLANSQRIQAATWENSLARMGAALLPLAKELTQFATDVMPSVADGITGVLKAAAPMLTLFLALGKLFLEHANVIGPALIAMVGVKMVLAYQRAAIAAAEAGVAAKGFGLAAKAAWGAALLGLPLLLEGLEQAGDGVQHLFAELLHGKRGAKTLEDLAELVGNGAFAAQLMAWGVSVKDFTAVLEAADGDAEAAFRAIQDNAGDVGKALFQLTVESDEAVSGMFKGWGERGPGSAAAAIAAGRAKVAAGAKEGITDPVAEAAEAAREAAVAEAFKMPAEIAQAIIDGRDLVLGAAEGLSDAATDPLLQQARIGEIRAQMKDLANVTADEIKKATPATIAADKLKYAELEIQLAGYLLRANPKSKEAAELLEKYAKSSDPATRAAYDALMGAVEDRAYIMANDIEAEAERAGISVEEAVKRHKVAARDEALAMARGVQKALIFDAYGGGFSIGEDWVEGITAGMSTSNARAVMQGVQNKLAAQFGRSLPTEGPFQHPEKGGFSIGSAWAEGIGKGISATSVLGLLGGPQLALAGASSVAAAPIPGFGGGTTVNHYYQLSVGGAVQTGSAADEVDVMQRLTELRA